MRVYFAVVFSLFLASSARAASYTGDAPASSYSGNGNNISSTTVTVSSSVTASQSVANLADIDVSTQALTARGGRPVLTLWTVDINNASGGARVYMLKVKMDGTAVSNTYTHDAAATSNSTLTLHVMQIGGVSAGSHTYTGTVATSNVTGTQTVTSRRLTVMEF